jgi:hypothetical protein
VLDLTQIGKTKAVFYLNGENTIPSQGKKMWISMQVSVAYYRFFARIGMTKNRFHCRKHFRQWNFNG